MAASIFETLTRSLSPSILSKAAATYGESESGIEKGLASAMAAVIAPLVARAGDVPLMRNLLGLAKEVPPDTTLVDDPSKVFNRAASSVGESNAVATLRSLVFGGNIQTITNAISNAAGVKPTTAASLFSVALPAVLGYLSRIAVRENLDPAGLGRRLAAERPSVTAALPASLSSLLPGLGEGAANISRAGSQAGAAVREAADGAGLAATSAERKSNATWIAAAFFALLAIGALYALMGRPERRDGGTAGAIGTAGYLSKALPDGTNLRFPAGSTEARLLAFIETNAPVDRETWYEFDRITFETDSATLRSQSREQLSNVAAILKSYSSVRTKIGGYTDNSGDPAANRKLSQARAEAVMAELRTMGVDRSRLEAEGYGDQHPVADNSRAEGRAQNRRVAVRVTGR
jgi:outer membrane protein OmpA-like peptidoglycan-associated protein